MGKSCSSVMTVYLPNLSYINIGVLGYMIIVSQKEIKVRKHHSQIGTTRKVFSYLHRRTRG